MKEEALQRTASELEQLKTFAEETIRDKDNEIQALIKLKDEALESNNALVNKHEMLECQIVEKAELINARESAIESLEKRIVELTDIEVNAVKQTDQFNQQISVIHELR